MRKIWQFSKDITTECLTVYWGLLRIIVPVMVIVEIGIRFGIVELLSGWCAPAMDLVGLPAETSVILATNLLVGIYGAAAALVAIAPTVDLTIADMTILGGMLLFVHALPMEQIIVKKTGVSLIFSTFTRLAAAALYAGLFHFIFTVFDIFQDPATILITVGSESADPTWLGWLKSSAMGLFSIFWILFFLITILRLMDISGVTRWITRLLTPVLRFLGIGPNAAPLTMIGILLGLAFGGGLILREVQKGQLQPKSIFLSMIFMGFCHSLIEDTLMIMAFGGHWSGVLIGRIVLSLLLILPISYVTLRMSDKSFNRYLYRMKSSDKNT